MTEFLCYKVWCTCCFDYAWLKYSDVSRNHNLPYLQRKAIETNQTQKKTNTLLHSVRALSLRSFCPSWDRVVLINLVQHNFVSTSKSTNGSLQINCFFLKCFEGSICFLYWLTNQLHIVAIQILDLQTHRIKDSGLLVLDLETKMQTKQFFHFNLKESWKARP